MKALLIALVSATTLSAQALDQTLPTVEWAREMLRQQIADFQGVPVDYYTPMTPVSIQWDDTRAQINGERCWFAFFTYEGKGAFLRGHGTTILQAVATAAGMVITSPEEQERQRQAAARSGGGLSTGTGDIYSKGGYGPGGAPLPSPALREVVSTPKPPYPSSFVQTHFSGEIKVRLTVQNGDVVAGEIISGPQMFADYVIEFCKANWKFARGTNSRYVLPISFVCPNK